MDSGQNSSVTSSGAIRVGRVSFTRLEQSLRPSFRCFSPVFVGYSCVLPHLSPSSPADLRAVINRRRRRSRSRQRNAKQSRLRNRFRPSTTIPLPVPPRRLLLRLQLPPRRPSRHAIDIESTPADQNCENGLESRNGCWIHHWARGIWEGS